MGTEFNLTDDQKQRNEDAKSAEEKDAVTMEALGDGIEISDEDLETVSGGQDVVIPATHEEIDAAWDEIEFLAWSSSDHAALCEAYNKKLIPMMHTVGGVNYFKKFSMSGERAKMHRALDAR